MMGLDGPMEASGMSDNDDEARLPPMSEAGGVRPPGPARQPPQIEGYEAAELLGQGGMGTVWRAVQQSTGRQVALKVLGRAAFGSDREQQRFEREVELAARLEHPHIARLYDSGLYYSMYYYAMELIDGAPLDEYVEQSGLNKHQILSLMRDICRAVQHAHQRGVIHRDLKPSNVLVTEDGQPHIVDFGLAKALEEKDTAVTVSMGGDVVGTPAYMSPEQAAGKISEADTRSDVYSLGVILYRLLTGASPHDMTGTRYDVLRRIAEEDARRPRAVAKAVDGELEALLLKALAHEPDDRYASAGDLADDIDRYLTGEPLSARAPTTIYFLRKRLRKYRALAAAACAVLAILIATFAWSYVRIREARDEAQEEAKAKRAAADFMADALRSIDPAEARGGEVGIRRFLNTAADQVGVRFSGQPLLEAETRQRLGVRYVVLGDHENARLHFSRALKLRRETLGESHPSTLESMHRLANALQAPEAEQLLRQVLERRRRILGEDDADTLRCMNDLAKTLFSRGKREDAEKLARQTVGMSQRALGKDNPHTLVFMADLAKILWDQERPGEAESLYRQVLAARRRVLGEDHRGTLSSMDDLANALRARGKQDEALALYREAAEIRERVLGEDHPATIKSLTTLANALIEMGRQKEAEPVRKQELKLRQQAVKRWIGDALAPMNRLANNLFHQSRYVEAEDLHREVLRVGERFLGKEHLLVLEFKNNLANDLHWQGRFREAEILHREVLEVRERVLGKRHPDTLLSMLNLANTLLPQEKYSEAEMLYREILERGQGLTGEQVPETLRRALEGLQKALKAQGKETEADAVRKRYEKIIPPPPKEEAEGHPAETTPVRTNGD